MSLRNQQYAKGGDNTHKFVFEVRVERLGASGGDFLFMCTSEEAR
jgi:hypothetical protein